MGVRFRGTETIHGRTIAPLHRVVLRWVRKNYRALYENHPTVAQACLMGGISYKPKKNRLVKTYAPRADRKPSREFIELL